MSEQSPDQQPLGSPAKAPSQASGQAWEPPTPEELQALLPQFEIESVLGCGGMGAVYKARQPGLGRYVALKILPPKIAKDDPDFVERFRREPRVMAQMNHPGIVTVHDSGAASDGTLFFTMELVEGTDLQHLIRKHGKLDPKRALSIAADVCDALDYAHSKGVVHRDIKPSNVMIDGNGRVKVADFGLAKTLGGALLTRLTLQGDVLGTLNYMPPESREDVSAADPRADLYAVGVMLHRMLTGEYPHRFGERPSELVTGLDPRLDKIVTQALEPDRNRRFQNSKEMKAALDEIASNPRAEVAPSQFHVQDEAPSPDGTHTPPSTSSTRGSSRSSRSISSAIGQPTLVRKKREITEAQPRRSRTGAVIVLAAGSLVALACAYLAIHHPDQESEQSISSGAPDAGIEAAPNSAQTPTVTTGSGNGNSTPSAVAPLTTPNPAGKPAWRVVSRSSIGPGISHGSIRAGEKTFTMSGQLTDNFAVTLLLEYDPAADDLGKLQKEDWEVRGAPEFRPWLYDTLPESGTASRQANLTIAGPRNTLLFDALEFRIKGRGAWVSLKNVSARTAEITATSGAAMPLTVNELTATQEQPFTNGLGMRFVPIAIQGGSTNGQRVLFSVWETRVKDYAGYASSSGLMPQKPGFPQTGDHPVVNVTWNDAKAFCAWLTKTEIAAGRLPKNWEYRLPSDHEWSCAVGLGGKENASLSPKATPQVAGYPWGTDKPPPPGAGNYNVDSSDGYANTAPVGSYQPSSNGLYDLGGNVWEFCEDLLENPSPSGGRVMRGGSWAVTDMKCMPSAHRHTSKPDVRADNDGFRCVISLVSTKPTASPPSAVKPETTGVIKPSVPPPVATTATALNSAPQKVANAAPSDALRFGSSKYKFFTESLSWSDAKKRAESLGGHLATITSAEEQKWLAGIIPSSLSVVWLGGKLDEKGSWTWITGEPWRYTAWAKKTDGTGEPSGQLSAGGLPENVLQYIRYNYPPPAGWNDAPDTLVPGSLKDHSGFLVEWEDLTASVPAALQITASKLIPLSHRILCNLHMAPANAVSFGSSKYQIIEQAGIQWDAARRAATQMGGHLVTITSAEEESFVKGMVIGMKQGSYFTGGTKKSINGGWEWITGEPWTYKISSSTTTKPGTATPPQETMFLLEGSHAHWLRRPTEPGFNGVGFVVEWGSPTPLTKEPQIAKLDEGFASAYERQVAPLDKIEAELVTQYRTFLSAEIARLRGLSGTINLTAALAFEKEIALLNKNMKVPSVKEPTNSAVITLRRQNYHATLGRLPGEREKPLAELYRSYAKALPFYIAEFSKAGKTEAANAAQQLRAALEARKYGVEF